MIKKIFLLLLIGMNLLFAQTYKKVEIVFNSPKELELISNELDHVSKYSPNSVSAFVNENEIKILQGKGFEIKILIDDWYKYYNEKIIPANEKFQKTEASFKKKSTPSNFDYGTMGGYYKLEEVYQRLDKMFQLYPDLITQRESIGKTNENRDIYFVKISDNPTTDEIDEPEVMFTSLHHAREPESMMQMIYFMWYLLENYDKDSGVKFLVDNREIYFIPVVNPDGYYYNQTTNPSGGGMWRKNRRDNNDGSFGVDLNRNYGPLEYWNSPNGGSSTSPNSDTYRGTAPFSEPETNAIKEFLKLHKISNALNYHTYSNLLIYPYGALGKETKDSLIFRAFAKDMTRYNFYVYGTDDQTVGYTTRGNSDDYFYDGDTIANGKIFAMTPEVGNGSDGFWPLQSRIIPLAEENLFPNLYWLWVAGGYVNVSELNYSKEFFNPGDTVTVSVKLKNKGLGTISDFNVSLQPTDQQIEVTSPEKVISQMTSQEELALDSVFQFVISSSVSKGQKINFNIIVADNSTEISRQEFSFFVGSPKYIFNNKVELNDSAWDFANSAWKPTSKDFYSADYSLTDSPSGYYSPNYKNEILLKTPIDLTNIQSPVLSFFTKFEIEKGWDFGQVLISRDDGVSWKSEGGNLSSVGSGDFQPVGERIYDGKISEWTKEEIDLSAYSGENILVKFVLTSDTYIEYDGWYIDDIGVYYYVLTGMEKSAEPVISFQLYQNYPNPFNPTTTINYSIPNVTLRQTQSDIPVTLKVYDILGREVATLVNEKQSAGNYEVKFDTTSVSRQISSGIYLYRLKAGDFVQSKKMILMK